MVGQESGVAGWEAKFLLMDSGRPSQCQLPLLGTVRIQFHVECFSCGCVCVCV